MEEKTKPTFRSWLSNFWYHYKWHTLFAAFILLVIAVLCIQSAETKDTDLKVLYAGPKIFSKEEKTAIERALSQVITADHNGDGKKDAEFADLTIITEEQLNRLRDNTDDLALLVTYNNYGEDTRRKNFTQEIFAGERVICLLDPTWYEVVRAQDGFLPLADVLGEKPENAFDDYSVRLCDTELAGFFECFGVLPEDTLLCIRRLSTAISFTGKARAVKNHEAHLAMFRDLMEFEIPEGFGKAET